ncbi:dirigent protein 1 [Gossypium australe]|uniref:Dirigent protein n=1 Tax=Gossypium australe TaxID=47621 RepID=A0A5B6X6C6_9ROSI|nr:dirigent protein 1 [Gossypium australe]
MKELLRFRQASVYTEEEFLQFMIIMIESFSSKCEPQSPTNSIAGTSIGLVVIAIAVVVLLALLSPVSHKSSSKNPSRPWLALSMYIQHPHISRSSVQPVAQSDAGAFVFHRALTEGPKNTSRIVGKAQGFIIPIEHFADSAFNIIYLTFETPKFNGSLSIQANNVEHEDRQELTVVGGTGYFAFARGLAVFMQTKSQSSEADPTYHVKLQLRFPNRSQTIPG